MSSLFRSGDSGESTLIIDVENGSVASALAHFSQREQPRLFGESRVELPVMHSVSSEALSRQIDRALEAALVETGSEAARLRRDKSTARYGRVGSVKIFLHAPWTIAVQGKNGISWSHEPSVRTQLYRCVGTVADTALVSFEPFGRAAAHAVHPHVRGEALVANVTGEVLELILARNGHVLGRATTPVGLHTILRTLKSHAGLSVREAQSALALAHHAEDPTYRYAQPLAAAINHFANEFSDVAQELLMHSDAQSILVLAPGNTADWFARALTTHPRTHALFPDGGVVRALRPRHFSTYLTAHAPEADVPLMIETMFINSTRHGR
jgi:hypothetical protein